MTEKVENIKRPLKKGEVYLVPCLVKKEIIIKDEEELWMDISSETTINKIHVLPIINHPHNDIENGQPETHYHLDYRFIKHNNDNNFPTIKNKHSIHKFGTEIRPQKEFGKLEHIPLPVINEEFKGITPVEFIGKSKLKHKCIHKGKCPHRRYDLSQVGQVNGTITCPLHGLRFNSKGKIINKNG